MANDILVLGSTGFVGGYITQEFKNLYNISTPNRKELDLLDYWSVQNYFSSKTFDVVINCAGNLRSQLSPFDVTAATENLLIFNNLYAVRHKYFKFINIGSGAEFDRSTNINCANEEQLFLKNPRDHYGLSKNIVSRMIYNTDNFYTLRLFGIFGPTESKTRLLKKILSGEHLEINDRYFDYFYIKDLIPILNYYIKENPKYKDINVVYPEKIRLGNFINQFCEIHNISKDNIRISDKLDLSYTGSPSKLIDLSIDLLGLQQGLKNYNGH